MSNNTVPYDVIGSFVTPLIKICSESSISVFSFKASCFMTDISACVSERKDVSELIVSLQVKVK